MSEGPTGKERLAGVGREYEEQRARLAGFYSAIGAAEAVVPSLRFAAEGGRFEFAGVPHAFAATFREYRSTAHKIQSYYTAVELKHVGPEGYFVRLSGRFFLFPDGAVYFTGKPPGGEREGMIDSGLTLPHDGLAVLYAMLTNDWPRTDRFLPT